MTAWSDRCLLERDSKDVDWVAGMCSIRPSNGVGRVPVEYLWRMLLQEIASSLWKTIPNWGHLAFAERSSAFLSSRKEQKCVC
jgi:hypothetical protein